jgi:hypothetical protein
LEASCVSRAGLESFIRQRTSALSNVVIHERHAAAGVTAEAKTSAEPELVG